MMENIRSHSHGSLRKTLMFCFLSISLLPLSFVSWFFYHESKGILEKAVSNDLERSSYHSAAFIHNWFNYRFTDSQSQASIASNIKTFNSLIEGASKDHHTLQSYVVSDDWTRRVQENTPDISSFSQRYNYVTDALFIDTQGNILFSVKQNSDLGKNVFDAHLSATLFSQAAAKSMVTSQTVFSGVEHYAPSGGDISGFVFSPMIDDQGRILGVVAIKITLDIIFDLLKDSQQNSLVHYLVDQEGLLVTAINGQQNEVLKRTINNEQMSLAIKEHGGLDSEPLEVAERAIQYIGPNGQSVFGMHQTMNIGGVNWYLISEIDSGEAFFAIRHLTLVTLILFLVTVILVIVLSIYVSSKLTRPILELLAVSQRVSEGELDVSVQVNSNNEIGLLAASFNKMLLARKYYDDALGKSNLQTKQALAQLEEQKFALDQHAIVDITDIDGNISFANARFCEMTGYTREEVIGQNHRILKSGLHPHEFYVDLYQKITMGKIWQGEVANKTKDNKIIWLDTTIVPFLDANHAPKSYIAMRTDITARKEAELELAESSSQLELVMLNTNVGIWDWKIMTGEVFCNERWYDICDYDNTASTATLNMDEWKRLIHPKDLTRSMKIMEQHFDGETDRYQCELRVKQSNGDWRWVMDSGRLVERSEHGFPYRMVGTLIDITERKNAEIEMKRTLSLLAAILDSTDNGILVTDEQGKAVQTNRRFADLWSIPDELLNQFDQDAMLNHIKSQLKAPESFIQALEGAHSDAVKEVFDEIIFNDGRVIERLSRPLDIDGQGSGRVWSFRDITQRREAERSLIESKEAAEAATRSKSEFLASMSHEIRTPMNGVLGMLSLLQNTALNSEQTRRVSIAQSSAKSLLSLINDILDFSKIDADKLELEMLDFNPRTVMDELAESMAHLAQDKGLELILDIRQVEQSFVTGDPSRLRQIFTNLISNAVKFTSVGEVVISAHLREKDADHWLFSGSIKDTGIGIPKEKQAMLFDSFTQVDASTTRHYGGTGLGLAIVKRLCELMGGGVSVRSQIGNGSEFSFEVIYGKSKRSVDVMPEIDISQLKLLVVDDNQTHREVLRGQLEHWGANVEEVDSAQKAIALCESCLTLNKPLFDIAYLDMQMPDMDGVRLGEFFHQHDVFKTIKLVMMTSMGDQGDAEYFAELGFSAYFSKPATTNDLFDSLAIVAKGGEVLEQANPLVISEYSKSLARQDKINLKATQWPDNARVLLVEDNHVNQLVAADILEAFGLMVDIVSDGKEALSMIQMSPQHSPYCLVLMDCQMPNMDGYEATRRIRQGVAGEANKSLVIVAMTANAMQGDREKCFEAGMNDYLSKPIDPQGLHQTLCHWLALENDSVTAETNDNHLVIEHLQRESPEVELNQAQKAPENTESTHNKDETMTLMIWDKDDALKRIMGKEKLLNMLIGVFNKEMPQRMEQLSQAVTAKNADEVVHLAHTIKGVAANLSGLRLQKHASELELAAKEGKVEEFSVLLSFVQNAYPELVTAFDAHQNEGNSSAAVTGTGMSQQAIKEKLQSLSSALINSEYIDPQSLDDLVNTGAGETLDGVLKALVEQINMFDFINAQVSLEKAIGLCDG